MKYRNFRAIARIIGLLAWILGILSFIAVLVSGIATGGAAGALLGIVLGIVSAFLAFISLYVLAQFIYVILDIEEHTRETRAALTKEGE